jgi:hypothetical protein
VRASQTAETAVRDASPELRYLAGFGDYLTPRIHVHRVSGSFRLRKAMLAAAGMPAW